MHQTGHTVPWDAGPVRPRAECAQRFSGSGTTAHGELAHEALRSDGTCSCGSAGFGLGAPGAGPGAGAAGRDPQGRVPGPEGVLALRRAQLPDPRVLGRHPPAHQRVPGRGRVRDPAGPRVRVPLRARRGADRLGGPQGQALAAARLPGHRRPLGQHGLLPRPVLGEAGDAGRSDRQALVRPGPGRRGERRQGGPRDHRLVLAGQVPEGARVPARIPGLPRRLGQGPSRPRRSTTTPAASPPSSATSGPRRSRPATTCIAW